MEKKNYPQVYSEEWKYKPKKVQMTKFIDTELGSESEQGLESVTELKSKIESVSDFD